MGKRTQLALRKEVARVFRDAMIARKLTVTAAARELGVSRQSMHKYLNGAVTPRADIVRKACSSWGMTMNVYGLVLSASDFGTPGGPRTVGPIQMSFSDMLRSLRDRNLEIKIVRAVGGSLELNVKIKFAS